MMLSEEEMKQVDWDVFDEEDIETLIDLQIIPKQEAEVSQCAVDMGYYIV